MFTDLFIVLKYENELQVMSFYQHNNVAPS